MKKKNTKRIGIRIATLVLFAGILTGLFCGVGFWKSFPVSAAEDPKTTYNIRSVQEFIDYSVSYAAGHKNRADVLNIAINSGNDISGFGFISLGTADRPFEGTLKISSIGQDIFRLFECPLFDYVSTDMTITGTSNLKIMREKVTAVAADGVKTSGALFANHVVAGTNAANWAITLLQFDNNGDNSRLAATSFEGLIGDIADEATVSVTFTNLSDMAVESANNVGLICGTLGEEAVLNVATSNTVTESGVTTTVTTPVSISSTGTNGNAGGLVGKMESGSTIQFNSENLSRVGSVTSANKFAGGIVGYADNITVAYKTGEGAVTDYAVSGSVSGKEGAGGLFGYYKNINSPVTFTLEDTYNIASGTTVSSTKYAGGVFGILENTGASFTFDGNASGSEVFTVALTGGTNRGGVCGGYATNALSNTLTFTNTSSTVRAASASSNSGGLIGSISTGPAYVTTTGNVSVTVGSGSLAGGLVGSLGSAGSFADLTGTITVSGSLDVGLIGNLPAGVLRLQGTTNLSAATTASAQIVGSRGRSLVYALGDGTGTNGNWTLKRRTSNAVDDIGTWGEVIRADGTILAEGDLFTVDASAHTVTLKGAYTTMDTLTKFALTALNIKLNTSAGDLGALKFTSGSANKSETLLAGTLTLGADLSLSGTGLTGLTRDDGVNNAFSGTFEGGNHSITLATGEQYGLRGNGDALIPTDRQGNIYTHLYNGLFAKTNNATVQNLTVSGNITIYQKAGTMYVGGISAFATGSLTLENNTVDFTQELKLGGDFEMHFGGAIGEASGSGLDIDVITSGSYLPAFVDKTASDIGSAGNFTTHIYAGGLIGYVSGSATQDIDISNCTVGIDYQKQPSGTNTHIASCFGGVIAKIANVAYAKDSRTVSLSSVTVDTTVVRGQSDNSGRKFGGILGTDWLAADVELDGVTLNADIESTTTRAVDYGGLVQIATGHWDIKNITIPEDKVSFNLPNNGSNTFGFVAGKTYVSESGKNGALYLDVDMETTETAGYYNIAELKFTGSTNFAQFDEIVTSSRFNTTGITSNGNSIISITTEGNLLSGAAGGYQNQTAYGQSGGGVEKNPDTRYYYNIAYARANKATSKYNFLVWTVGQYAHSSLASWFKASNTFTGDLDMTGLSYYPIDLTSAVTFNNVSALKLDNKTMEGRVITACTSTDTRSTRVGDNQHYLMHTAVFRNVTANINVTTGMTMQGNVPRLSSSYCGFLVAGTLGGSDTRSTNLVAANLTLDGVSILNTSDENPYTYDIYAPLLINKVGRATTLTINGAAQSSSAYSAFAGNGWYAGSSLIGDVGDETARAIYLTFTGLKFDGRSAVNAIGNLNTKYGTTKSIFKRATILNSFLYAGESSGAYTFTVANDWSSSSNPAHNVTYGKEITTSVEFAGLQKQYSGSAYYTDPVTYHAGSEYDFSTGFLPYVYTAYDLAASKHEISVNINASGIIKGCGKYGDPYIIDDNNKLSIIAKIIKGDNVTSAVEIWLPTGTDALPADSSSSANFNYTGTNYTKYLYNFDTTTLISSNGGYQQTNANVRQYLAGAYYVITKDITLPSSGSYAYVSLGVSGSAQYAFRGVLIGRGNPTITNTSRNPLITNAMGCVVKDLTIDVNVSYGGTDEIALAAPAGSATFSLSGGIGTYGAVIGKILGGDNVIDNVQVTYTGATFNITKATVSTYERLVPVGGYVGALVNGGLIFRNMEAANAEDTRFVGLTKSYLAGDAERELPVRLKVAGTAVDVDAEYDGFLYINPIIGRVIAGYAFYEGDTYHATEETATLKNGKKNYTIADLSLSEGKLGVARSGSNFNITVPDGQAMFVLGAIVNSGAGSASYNGSTEDSYQALELFWQAYSQHTTTRAGANYSAVGNADFADDEDYTDYAVNDAYNPTATLSGIPYIVRAYTAKDGSVYSARCITTTSSNVIKVTGTCDVAAGFRGIGSIYYDSSYTRLRISKMAGMSGETPTKRQIVLHMDFREYNHKSVTKYIATASSTSNTENTAGFGLFNRLDMTSPSDSNSVQYLELSGSVFYDVYTIIGEILYTPVFIKNTTATTVTWKNADGSTIYSASYSAGTMPTYDSGTYGTPTKGSEIFIGWNTVITNANTGAVSCTAQFTSTKSAYRAMWKATDGVTAVTSTNYNNGTTPAFSGTAPTSSGNTLIGWTVQIDSVAGRPAACNFATFGTKDRTEAVNINLDTENITMRRTMLSTGGLAGFVCSKVYIKNVTFNDLSVEGAKNAGGLIGFAHFGNDDVLTIEYTGGVTNAGYVNVVGGQTAGGLVGRLYRMQISVLGATGGTDIIVKNVESKNADPNEAGMYYFANINTGVGGIIGTCWAMDKLKNGTGDSEKGVSYTLEKGQKATTRRLYIYNINVVKGTNEANVRVLNDRAGGNDNRMNYAGGFLGSAHNVYIRLENCNLSGVNVTANAAGGFVGRLTQKYYLEIIRCSANGNNKAASISGTRFAGGAVGWAMGRDYLYFQLLNFSAVNYAIESLTTGQNMGGAGGAVGYAQGNNKGLADSNNYTCEFNNIEILNCQIKTNYTDTNLTTHYLRFKCGTGGIIGVIDTITFSDGNRAPAESSRNAANKYKFSGYNILVKDCTLIHLQGGDPAKNYSVATGTNKNRRIGDLVGNNAVQTPLKFVGVSVENTGYYENATTNAYCGKHVGYYDSDDNNYGTSNSVGTYGDGYVVFANFNGITGGTTFPNVDEAGYAADNCTNVAAASPYATVNPTLDLGTWHLTGDGTADSVANLAIQNILADGVSGVYTYAAGDYYTGSSGDTNYAAFSASTSKLVMFSSVASGYLGTDFPVLIVNDTNHDNSHKLINSYLRLLTNTTHDFGTDSTNEYAVVIYNMIYENSVWRPRATGATPRSTDPSLKIIDDQFCMTPNAFDSGKTQFSLIDVRFFDPAKPTQVAYHLYIPVFVEKVLSYQFDIAALSGTEYLKSAYTSDFGQSLIENTGTPVTLFFRYTYSKTNAQAETASTLKTTAEWQSAINAGDDLTWGNYAKTLQFYKANTSDVLDDLPDDTILVLIDPNDGGKPYYAKLREYTADVQTGGALWGNQLELGRFKDTMSKDGSGNIVISGTAFAPKSMQELLGLAAVPDDSGKMMECPDNEATVMVGTQGYRPITTEDSPGEGEKFTITVTDAPVMEQYYISIFTESNLVNDELFHYYLISSSAALDGVGCPPSRITDTGAHTMVHMIMGKIFEHTNLTLESDPDDNGVVMTADNNSLTVDMSIELGISDSLEGDIKTQMQTYISATNVYQAFLVYLNRVEGIATTKAILGNPSGSGDYTLTKLNPGDPDPENPPTYGTETAYALVDVTQNRAQFRTGDLSAYFATGNSFVITSEITLTYDGGAIPAQFPGRSTSAPDNGAWVSCSSNLGFTADGVTNSKNRVSLDEDPKKTFYSETLPDVATLDLNPLGDRVGDFTPLGINAANNEGRNAESFDLYAILDISTIADQVTDYHDAVVTVTLGKKENDGTYSAVSDVSQYFTIKLANRETLVDIDSPLFALSGENSAYTAVVGTSLLSDNGAEITLPLLRLTVKTGAALQTAGLTYGNYRVNVAVELRDDGGRVITVSHAENFVIYSNVKVIPSFLEN